MSEKKATLIKRVGTAQKSESKEESSEAGVYSTDIGSEELFIAVERLMISNRVAHNVSLVQPITDSKFTVVYNAL